MTFTRLAVMGRLKGPWDDSRTRLGQAVTLSPSWGTGSESGLGTGKGAGQGWGSHPS